LKSVQRFLFLLLIWKRPTTILLVVAEVIRQFMTRGVVVKTVIDWMAFDGATQNPMQKPRGTR
jgi:hypothetical protein